MLPDFLYVKEAIARAVNAVLRNMVDASPLVGMVRKERHYEGSGWSPYGEDAEVVGRRYKEIRQPAELGRDDLIEKGPNAIAEMLPKMARAAAAQIEMMMRQTMEDAAAAGSPHAATFQGMPSSCEQIIELLERMQIDFDDEGRPIMPGLVVTDVAVLRRISEFEADPRCRAKLEALLKEKKEAYDAREAARALVD